MGGREAGVLTSRPNMAATRTSLTPRAWGLKLRVVIADTVCYRHAKLQPEARARGGDIRGAVVNECSPRSINGRSCALHTSRARYI